MRIMYDAVTAANITKASPPPQLVAGYIDKIVLVPWSQADWARFPGIPKVQVVKKATTNAGHVLDVEPGDATPAQAPGWAAMRRRSGFAYPVIYCNRSTWPQVKAAFAAQKVPPPLYWIATGTGRREIPDGAIAAQYLLDVAPGIDISVVADYWPGVDPFPNPTPTQPRRTRSGDEVMQIITSPGCSRDAGGKLVPQTFTFPCPVGSVSQVLAHAWISFKSAGSNTVTDYVHFYGIRSQPQWSMKGGGYPLDVTHKGVKPDSQRVYEEIPDGCDQVTVEVACSGPFGLCLELDPK